MTLKTLAHDKKHQENQTTWELYKNEKHAKQSREQT